MVAAKLSTFGKGRPQDNASIDALKQDEAAELLNVSRPSVQRARKVQESGDAKLIAAVESGKITVSAAAQHVAAVTRYPELSVIPTQKDVVTVAKNLDALPEDERMEARSSLLKHDQHTLALLAEKPPMPKDAPKKAARCF